MHGFMDWSLKLPWRPFGITVKLHLLLIIIFVAEFIGFIFSSGTNGLVVFILTYVGVFFLILLHEYGHCFAARNVGGSANEVTLWPLGGLAHCHAPNTPEAQMKVAVGGPAVTVVCGLVLGALLLLLDVPMWMDWDEWHHVRQTSLPATLLKNLFWWNTIILLFNMLPAFPMDAGRMLQCYLWPKMGFGTATLKAIWVSNFCAVGLVVVGVVWREPIFMFLAFFNYTSALQTKQMLQAGMLVDESVFGYDFSGGYTTLDASSSQQAQPRKPGPFKRWSDKRKESKLLREKEAWENTQLRVDELLDKVSEGGLHALTDEERTFLRNASKKY
jgi:stage IV sporulation protein FB